MNGALIPADQVRVSPFDLGWSVGWAAFETMPGYDGRIFGFLRHFERLKHSAGVMGIYVPAPEIIQTAVSQVLDVNGLGDRNKNQNGKVCVCHLHTIVVSFSDDGWLWLEESHSKTKHR